MHKALFSRLSHKIATKRPAANKFDLKCKTVNLVDQPFRYMIRGKMMSCFKYLFQSTPLLYIKEFSLSSVFYNFLKKILKKFFVRLFCLFYVFSDLFGH